MIPLDLLQQEYGLRTEKCLRPTDWINPLNTELNPICH